MQLRCRRVDALAHWNDRTPPLCFKDDGMDVLQMDAIVKIWRSVLPYDVFEFCMSLGQDCGMQKNPNDRSEHDGDGPFGSVRNCTAKSS